MVYTRTPSSFAILEASSGEMSPLLFSASVRRTASFDFAAGAGSRFSAAGLHADSQQLRHIGGIERRDVPAVVLPVRQEDRHLRLRGRVAQHVHGCREAGADRGAASK